MKIAVLDGHTLNPDGQSPWDEISSIGDCVVYDRTNDADFFKRAIDADIILTNKVVLNAERINKLPKLKFVSVLATGYNVVDANAVKKRGIPVCNVPAYGTESVVQHVLAFIFEHLNAVGGNAASVANGEWCRSEDFCFWNKTVRLFSELTLGIVGLGTIGRRVAESARTLGVGRILYYNRTPKQCDIATPSSIEEIFSESDIVSLHCALGEDNAGFVDGKLLSSMKDGSLLVNTARGALIDECALACELKKRRIFAALDVLSKEPPTKDNPLLSAPNCTITPHMAWSAVTARRNLLKITRDNILGFMTGKLQNRVL